MRSHSRLTATLGRHYTHQQPYKEGLQVDTEIPPDSCFAFIRLISEGDIE